jgi:hypothetical protein
VASDAPVSIPQKTGAAWHSVEEAMKLFANIGDDVAQEDPRRIGVTAIREYPLQERGLLPPAAHFLVFPLPPRHFCLLSLRNGASRGSYTAMTLLTLISVEALFG